MTDFWKTIAAGTTTAPFTVEDLRRAFKAIEEMPARRCPHIHSYSHRQRLLDEGFTTTHCLYCGDLVRL